MTTTRASGTERRLAHLAPLASIAVLVGLASVFPLAARARPEDAAHKRAVAEAMTSAPRFIGPWTGIDAPVPAEAQKLLRPNAILSRTYTRPGRSGVHVLIVHCNDARDMIGHYPPICYPGSGWVLATTPTDVRLRILADDAARPFRMYEFRRLREHGVEEQIRIFDAFILPDGTVTGEIDDINRLSERVAVSARGLAQVQVITPGRTALDDAVAVAEELLQGLSALAQTLRIGQGETHDE
ncbi:MAG: exosortase-associated EpsI family protein [Phycisphaerales bacterium]|nr:exosortase-associated EpsI family protein [Phycisphaerales bacterium]